MKKIMFNDDFGLTKAVLEGRKTQTRRIVKCPKTYKGEDVRGFYVYKKETDSEIVGFICIHDADGFEFEGGELLPPYKVGEIVAVAQCYADCELDKEGYHIMPKNSGYFNKMFVKADLMPNQIQITDVFIERLQDISEEDCLAEGIVKKLGYEGYPRYYVPWAKHQWAYATDNAKDAYRFLVDKVQGKGTWESNPWVWVYDFKLVGQEQ